MSVRDIRREKITGFHWLYHGIYFEISSSPISFSYALYVQMNDKV